MNRFLKTYIPSAAITFTATILLVSLLNLISGYEYQSNVWLWELFTFIVLIDAVDFLLAKINFKSYTAYYLTELIITYVIMLVVGYAGNWFAFTAFELLRTTAIYLSVFSLVHLYFYRRAKGNAEEINKYLNERK